MLKIVGDINFSDGFFDMGFGVGAAIRKGFDPFAKLYRKRTDFWIGNLECVCANTSDKQGVYAKQFLISPRDLMHVKHLDLYGAANNHVMQHGESAYREMLWYLSEHGVQYVGSLERRSTTFFHEGKKVGIMAFSQRPDNFSQRPLYWCLPEYAEIQSELAKLADCDFRIIFVHWGNEFINYPYLDQKAFAHFMVDCGADLIVGMHPHILQGYEIYHGKHIFYSLGNCVFNMPWEPTKYSIVLQVDLSGDTIISYEYLKIGDDYLPEIVKDVPPGYRMEDLNKFITLSNENEIYYKQVFAYTRKYKKENRRDIATHFLKLNFKDAVVVIKDFINRRLK